MTQFKHATRLLLLSMLAIGLIGCGFQLRDQAEIPSRLNVITLQSESGSDRFDRALYIALNKAGIIIIDEIYATEDTLELKVNAIESSTTELARTFSDNDISQSYQELSSYYFIRQANGKSLYGPRSIRSSRALTNQDAEASAKRSYNLEQTDKMYDELAKQLVDDLSHAPL